MLIRVKVTAAKHFIGLGNLFWKCPPVIVYSETVFLRELQIYSGQELDFMKVDLCISTAFKKAFSKIIWPESPGHGPIKMKFSIILHFVYFKHSHCHFSVNHIDYKDRSFIYAFIFVYSIPIVSDLGAVCVALATVWWSRYKVISHSEDKWSPSLVSK